MLKEHLKEWKNFNSKHKWRAIVVDDGSNEDPALTHITDVGFPIEVFRIKVDIPWNQHGARNLAAQQCKTDWMFMCDIDHVLESTEARKILNLSLDKEIGKTKFFKFNRRNKNNKQLDIKKRIPFNIFMCTKDAFDQAGGYDEDYCGTYGGDGPFIRSLQKNREIIIPNNIFLTVWGGMGTKNLDRVYYKNLYKEKLAEKKKLKDMIPKNPIRFPWERLL